jgi:hypothetical protein
MHEFRGMTQNFSPAVIEMDAAMRGPEGCVTTGLQQ